MTIAHNFRDQPGQFFRDQLAFLLSKINIPTRRWDDLWREQHNVGFMVAGAYKADLLEELRQSIDKAISRGESLGTFKRNFRQVVKRHGWQHYGTTGWRSRLIYETNLRTSYSAGRYRQLKNPAMLQVRPFWQYNHNDWVAHPRPHHVSWDGLVLRHDHPWWDTQWPPGGYGCRCFVRSLGPRDMAKLGKLGPDAAPPTQFRTFRRRATGEVFKVPAGVDPGFDYIPGRFVGGRPDRPGVMVRQVAERLAPKTRTLPPDLGEDLARVIIAAVKGRRTFGRAGRLSFLRGILPQRWWLLIGIVPGLTASSQPVIDSY